MVTARSSSSVLKVRVLEYLSQLVGKVAATGTRIPYSRPVLLESSTGTVVPVQCTKEVVLQVPVYTVPVHVLTHVPSTGT